MELGLSWSFTGLHFFLLHLRVGLLLLHLRVGLLLLHLRVGLLLLHLRVGLLLLHLRVGLLLLHLRVGLFLLQLRVGLLLLQLFLNGGATDIVFAILLCIAVGTATAWCGDRYTMPDGHCRNILLFWRRSTAALVFRVGACFEVSLLYPLSPLVPLPNRPSRLRGR